jgi:type IV secretion system protein VirD4
LDDWSALTPLAAPILDLALPGHGAPTSEGGLQQQPELIDAFTPQPEHLNDDLALLDDDAFALQLPARIDPRPQRTARLAALDTDDGIAL